MFVWPKPVPWSLPQRRALLVIFAAVGVLLAYRVLRNPLHVPDPQPPAGPERAHLATGIDPNTADARLLAAIPGIGPAMAARIVEYRTSYMAENAGRPAFEAPEDLDAVRGIGPAVVQSLTPYLVFASQSPASQPISLDP